MPLFNQTSTGRARSVGVGTLLRRQWLGHWHQRGIKAHPSTEDLSLVPTFLSGGEDSGEGKKAFIFDVFISQRFCTQRPLV